MLICPQCEFENPDDNKFCQRCGTSLTHKTCYECGASISWEAQECFNCGANVASVWWATIWQLEKFAQPTATKAKSIKEEPKATDFANQSKPHKSGLQVYIDPEQRYYLEQTLDLEMVPKYFNQVQQVKVIDTDPLQKPLLDRYLDWQQKKLVESESGKPADLPTSKSHDWQDLMAIPDLAYSYLQLQESCTPAVPIIHDAWQWQGKATILLEVRQDWQPLTELWFQEQRDPYQIKYWLEEMVILWAQLAPVGCCQSLLIETNLCVDENQILCLRELYSDYAEQQPSLQDLAQLWQGWSDRTDWSQQHPLNLLIDQMLQEKISTVEELQLQLQDLELSEINPDQDTLKKQQGAIVPEIENDDSPTLTPVSDNFAKGGDNDVSEMQTVVLPMQLSKLENASATDIGCQRHYNEDYYGIETYISRQENNFGKRVQAKGLFIVCDGMGGHEGGEIASALAVNSLQEYFQQHWHDQLPDLETVRKGVLKANQDIYDLNQERASSGNQRMGTTLVMALVHDTNLVIAHVGDSRIYSYTRKQGLEQLTVDHEVGQREIKLGVAPAVAYARPDAYQLTQALGPRSSDFLDPDIYYQEINEDTLLLLCSDGLSDNNLIEENWKTHLAPLIRSKANLEEGMLNLIEFANQYNGHDNITAVMARIKVRPNLEQQHLY